MKLNETEREALLASAAMHEKADKEINVSCDRLLAGGYTVYAKKLREVVIQMIEHVDAARNLARKP